MKNFFAAISVLILILILVGCVQMNTTERPTRLQVRDVKIWDGTPVQNLASAGNNQNVKQIEKLAKEQSDIINYQEPQFGMTLLLWSVGMEKYKATKALLECGADPNIIGTWEGGTALYRASGYSFIDTEAKQDAKYVKLLLEYGADPNTTFEAMLYAHYLIAEKGAKVTEPYSGFLGYGSTIDTSDTPMHYPVEILRNWIPRLDSEGYKVKMEIVEEFARQGVDYWTTEIPKDRLEQIQKLYPDTWKEYIQKY